MQNEITNLINQYPLLYEIKDLQEVLWINGQLQPFAQAKDQIALNMADILDASERLTRFAPFIKTAFPETTSTGGIIESPLRELNHVAEGIDKFFNVQAEGKLLLKQILYEAKTDINISHLADGIYFMKLLGEEGVVVKKFVKE